MAGLYGLPNLNKSGIDLSGSVLGGEDLNTVIATGCYHGNRDVLNLPEGVSDYWVMLVFSYISQWRIYVQLLSCNAVNKMYIRYRYVNWAVDVIFWDTMFIAADLIQSMKFSLCRKAWFRDIQTTILLLHTIFRLR